MLNASTASHINNIGLFEKTEGAGTSAVAAGVVNSGTITAASETLDLQGAFTGTGKDEIDPGAALEADGTVGGGQSFTYAATGGDLVIDDLHFGAANLFQGTSSGSGAGTRDQELDAGVPFGAGTTFRFTENPGDASGALVLTDVTSGGAIHATIRFLGDYSKSNLTHRRDAVHVPSVGAGRLFRG